jgi:hypothetical protein
MRVYLVVPAVAVSEENLPLSILKELDYYTADLTGFKNLLGLFD